MVLCNCKIQPNPFPANQNHSSWTYIYQACSSWTTQIHDWSSVSPLQTPKQQWAFRIKENKENILANSLLRKVSSIWHHICNASWLFWTCKTNSYLEWGNTEISKSAGQTHILKPYFKSVIKPDKLSNKCCYFCTNIVKKCVFQVQPDISTRLRTLTVSMGTGASNGPAVTQLVILFRKRNLLRHIVHCTFLQS